MTSTPAGRQPRLKDVAAAAGVSAMTVSLALRNHTSIPLRTRNRIQKIAVRIGYRPDPNISKLMERVRAAKSSSTGTVIAYLTAHEQRAEWKKIPTQRDYHGGAAKRAHELGYTLEEFWLREPGMTEQRLSRILRNRGIDGILIAPLQLPGSLYKKLQWQHFSVVELGYSLRNPVLHRCCNQQFQSMMLLLKKLGEAGYRRIGLAMGPGQDERANHHWRAAYLANQSLRPKLGIQELPMLLGDTGKWKLETFSRWFEMTKPDVVVTVGADVQRWLHSIDLVVPCRIGMANVDINETMPGVTGINQNALQVGAAAVDLLLSLMRTGERGLPLIPRTLMVEGTFVQGGSTRTAVVARKKRTQAHPGL